MEDKTELNEESDVFVTQYQTGEWWVDLGDQGMVVSDRQRDELIVHLTAFLNGTQGRDPYPRGDEPIVVIDGPDRNVHVAVANAWANMSRRDAEELLTELIDRQREDREENWDEGEE